jgi:hypothetical protein
LPLHGGGIDGIADFFATSCLSALSLFATASATAAMAASLILRRGFRATRLLNMPTVVTGVAP